MNRPNPSVVILNSSTVSPDPMASSSWQDRFRKERIAKNALAQQVKDLNAEIVQFQKTSSLATSPAINNGNGFTKEETNFVHDLKSRNQALLGENKRLKGKLKCAFFTVQRLKQQVQSCKQRLKASRHVSFGNSLLGEGCSASASPSPSPSARTHHVLEQKLKAALEENQLMRDENNCLRDLDACAYSDKRSTRTPAKVEFAIGESALQSALEDRDLHPRVTQLLEELREAMDAAKVVKVEYDTLESTSQVQLHMHKKTRTRLEQCNAYIRKLQNQINELESVKLVTKKEYVRLDQYKQHVDELMGENSRLEDKLANLCDLPFIQEEEEAVVNVQDQYYMEELQDLESELDRHKHQVDVLTNANLCLEAHLDALEDENHSLRSSCDDLQEQIGHLDNEFAQFRDNRHNNQRQMWTQCSLFDEDCPATRTRVEEISSIDKVHISSSLLPVPSGTNRLNLLAKIDILQHASMRQLTLLPFRERCKQISFVKKQDSQNIHNAEKASLDPGQEEVMLKASVIRCQLDHPSIDEETKSVLVMTLLNFEPMMSIIATGLDPKYEFSVSISLKCKWFTPPESLEYVKVKFEIYKTLDNVLESIGHARVLTMNLRSLLQENRAQLILDLISQGQKIGFVKVNLGISPLEPTSMENGSCVG